MRAIITGQVGMDKKSYLKEVADFAAAQGEPIEMYHVGNMMYDEAPDIRDGRILDLPISRLSSLRRAAFKDIIADAPNHNHALINTHATFRWRHGLFSAFDFDQITKLAPDIFVCLVDNIEVVHQRLHSEHDIDATLKDCMVWRGEEILATELMSQAIPGSKFYIVARGRFSQTSKTLFQLMCRPDMRRVYPSFPMSHVIDMPEVMAEIDAFRMKLAEHFICFDPGDVDEKLLLDRAVEAVKEGKDFFDHKPIQLGGLDKGAEPIRMKTREVLDIAGDIDGQIYTRDFKLIDQADMIVSFVPELKSESGKIIPGLSSGVERELQHAWEHAKEVYVVWKPSKNPSPFITETATKVFDSVDEALSYFEEKGMFAEKNLFGN